MVDVYGMVTETIIRQLEEGTVPWHKPWTDIHSGAFNRISGRQYSLLNQMLLKHTGEYASLNQWNKLGGSVRKGEKSEIVTFWKLPEEDPETVENASGTDRKPHAETNRRPILRYYRVFHISQVEGVEPLDVSLPGSNIVPDREAEAVFHNYLDFEGVRFEQSLSDKAYYSPSEDMIHLPYMCQFDTEASYYGTLYHEVVHSTGHLERLNRKGIQQVSFGSEEYSLEELIAEIGSACMLATLGISTDASITNNAAYVDGWLKTLKNDRRLAVSAAGQAEKAVKYVLETYNPQFRSPMCATP